MRKKQKTIEEVLKEVVVPEKEQPYVVPENWRWVKIKGIGSVKGGKRLPKGHTLLEICTPYPYLRVADFKNGTIDSKDLKYISADTASKISRYTISKDDVYISIAGTIGRTGIVPNDLNGSNLTENAAKITNIKGISNKFINLVLNTDELQNQIKQSAVSTSQPKLALFRIEELKIPLPPLREQNRIVEHTEHLLNKIEDAKQLIKEAKETFELRRSAILENAFTGRLTRNFEQDEKYDKSSYLKKIKELKLEKYNELVIKSNEQQTKKPSKPKFFNEISESHIIENIPTNWLCTTLGNVIYDFKYGTSEKSDYTNQGQPVIRIPNIDEEYVSTNDMKFLNDNIHITEEIVENGDLLIIRSNGSRNLVGKCSLVDDKTSGYAYASYLIRMRPIGVDSKFIYWLLKSNLVRSQLFSSSKSSAGINNINSQELASIVISLPSYKEQKEIVSKIESLISKEKSILESIPSKKILDELKQSILSKAFKGELGTNNPNDEPAIELLKSILQEKL
ncbi:restriction endonuclease subunit S [Bacillus cereus group sp. BfR-BA-01403]|uniref:restriction endonuclease subunit S n=1 Tax=Bacillus cereus group sp. BfR-BA-01403 TaxID=2920336 RepID=UPI001F58A0F3|nr:restriction endonuclease subunit S [Bacillus cereus group sp. BfR-BA-01403]